MWWTGCVPWPRAEGEQDCGRQTGQGPCGGQHGAVRGQHLGLGRRVEDGTGQRPGKGTPRHSLLDLGGIGAQLGLNGAVGGVELEWVQRGKTQQQRGGEREPGDHGNPGADRAGAHPAR